MGSTYKENKNLVDFRPALHIEVGLLYNVLHIQGAVGL
jgi:hypothetical protein